MYKFIEECDNDYFVREDDIKRIEEAWEIKFPSILKQFYCNYNGAKIYLCSFYLNDFEYEIAKIIPLKYGYCFEKIIANDRQDGIIPKDMIPIARNEGGDYYYWNLLNENIFLYYCDDIENPVYICENIEKLFEIMNESV